jgi:TonB family protein
MHPTDSTPTDGNPSPETERRESPRVSPNSLSYVNLDETNGGILLNVSESGLAVQAAMNVMEDVLPNVRLQIPRSKMRIEGSARVVWTSDSRKKVGIQFEHLPEEARKQLRDWLVAEGAAVGDQPASAPDAPSQSELDVPPVGDMIHVPKLVHPLPVEVDELDLSTLWMTSEHASSIAIPAQTVTPVQHTGEAPPPRPVQQIPAPVEHGVAARSSADLRSRYAPVIAALAILSLAAGWEAGRGNMFQSVFGIFESSSAAAPPSTNGAAMRASVNPASLSFLVVDATNQSWLVAFAGPTSAPPSAPIPALPPQSRANDGPVASSSRAPIRQWTLAAPQNRNRNANVQNAIQAPQLSSPQASNLSALSAEIPGGIGTQAPGPPVSTYSNLVTATVVHRIDPVYPQSAIQQRVEGTVRVRARISETGAVGDVSALNGSPLLQTAAVNAVKKWTFKPEVLDGRPVASDFDVNIRFSLPQ